MKSSELHFRAANEPCLKFSLAMRSVGVYTFLMQIEHMNGNSGEPLTYTEVRELQQMLTDITKIAVAFSEVLAMGTLQSGLKHDEKIRAILKKMLDTKSEPL